MVNIDALSSKLSIRTRLSRECEKLSVIDAVEVVKGDMRRQLADAVSEKAVITCRLFPYREPGKAYAEKFDKEFASDIWVFNRTELAHLIERVRKEAQDAV